jgi:predicted membrane metal-binding protein
MITDQLFLFILLIHFLADFGLQTHEQATNKGTSNKWLTYHVGVYSIIWLFASYVFFGSWLLAAIFAVITFCCHFITDWATSRIGKPFWEKQDLHNGFVVVGFDQVLHYIQLYYTFQFIMEGKVILGL